MRSACPRRRTGAAGASRCGALRGLRVQSCWAGWPSSLCEQSRLAQSFSLASLLTRGCHSHPLHLRLSPRCHPRAGSTSRTPSPTPSSSRATLPTTFSASPAHSASMASSPGLHHSPAPPPADLPLVSSSALPSASWAASCSFSASSAASQVCHQPSCPSCRKPLPVLYTVGILVSLTGTGFLIGVSGPVSRRHSLTIKDSLQAS